MRSYLGYINYLGRLPKKSAWLVRQAGFTITEVLLASSMMVIVISVAGIGVINLLRSDYRANADSEIQNNLNRTLEFVSDEVRRAKIIPDSEAAIMTDKLPEGARAVLAFQILNPSNPGQFLPNQLVYYTTSPGPESSLTGPRILWRYGPNLDANGNYDITSSWQHSPVTDMLAEDAVNPNCPTDFNRIPANPSSADGFYTCVRTGGDQVILNANAQVEMTTLTAGKRDKVDYAASTRVATRAICSRSDPICLITPPFDLGANIGAKKIATIPVLNIAANVTAEVIQGPNCSPCSVAASPDPNAPPPGVDIPSTVPVNAGEAVIIRVNDLINNQFPDPSTGEIKAYTSTSTDSPISLNKDQALLVFTTPSSSHQVLLTI
ncbi:type II secretion system protein J, partial [Microcystis sp.]|uniref:PulJ/GspJ family protein n=1 Tax=Microcystis sp. TaxID=1127 RepID=UPI00391CC99D